MARFTGISFPRLVAPLVLLAAAVAAEPQLPMLVTPDTGLPIELDADFSEFDRRSDRLVFRGLRVRQGPLAITAAEASASPANFTDSTWIFTGNVVIEDATTRVDCERAELRFRDNRLVRAQLQGAPARFRQTRPGGTAPVEGRAGRLDYDLGQGVIRLAGDAWLADGQNEVAGDQIAYDLRREVVTAGAGQSGPVRMLITPPAVPERE